MAAFTDRLNEWKREMKKVCPKPKVGQHVVVWDNLYERIELPKEDKHAGHHRWHRLSALEILEKFTKDTVYVKHMSVKGYLDSFNKSKPTNHKSCDD